MAVDCSGLRLRLLKMQAQAGDIVLLFQDESEALPWIGALDAAVGTLAVETSRCRGRPRLEHLDIVLDTPSAVVSSEAGAGIDETQDVFA